jgi:glycolate oxidase FAD binding subunit
MSATIPAPSPSVLTDPVLARLSDQIRQASQDRQPLCLRGHGSKDFYGGPPQGAVLDTRPLNGISVYEPSEMVVTVRAGTPLTDLEAELAAARQCLAFEPPWLGSRDSRGGGTVGGMVAAGLAGPARVSMGSVRDSVLGAVLVDGRGQSLRFGGQVMKNVAGYDVSRVLPGSLGVLGLIAEVSLKVMPLPPVCLSVALPVSQNAFAPLLSRLIAASCPVRASAWHDDTAWIRLAGADASIERALRLLETQASAHQCLNDEADATVWSSLRHQTHDFFRPAPHTRLWRISLPPLAPQLDLPGNPLIEWHGALRWLWSDLPVEHVRAAAQALGGHASIYLKASVEDEAIFSPLPTVQQQVHRRLKSHFDPSGIFNPGRLYPWL